MMRVMVIAAFAAACSKNVRPDKATGDDGRYDKAPEVVIDPEDSLEVTARGIVTWPGGDRIDWRKIELPEKATGKLTLKLSWTTPRPDLALEIDAFDRWGRDPKGMKRANKKSKSRRTLTIPGAKSFYYVRVMAVGRGDAGRYHLRVAFEPDPPTDDWPPAGITIPDPPALPAPQKYCDAKTFDRSDPACKNVCPDPPIEKWPACGDICPTVPDYDLEICQRTAVCPNPPDKRVKRCKGKVPMCKPGEPVTDHCIEPPPTPPKPVLGLVTNANANARGGSTITINRGQNYKVERGWRGRLMKGGKPVASSDFVVTRVGSKDATADVNLTTDQVNANKTVELLPP